MNFIFHKPENWKSLPMFKKIKIYGDNLTEDFAKYVDKLQAKEIVKYICGNSIQTPKVIKIVDFSNITNEDLNINHIIKSSHASGWNINIDSSTNIEEIRPKLKAWNTKYNTVSQKQYSFLQPNFFIEEKINDNILGHTGNALVYMIRCINGKPISIGVKYKKIQNSYDIEWNLTQNPKIPFEIPKPKNISLMLKLASLLSNNFEFVRIDFYIGKNNIIYFSEFTFTPAGGNQVYDMDTELYQGSLWI